MSAANIGAEVMYLMMKRISCRTGFVTYASRWRNYESAPRERWTRRISARWSTHSGPNCASAFRGIKRFPGYDVQMTEDAELGVRLCNAGYAGRFINQVVGQGLLPFSLKDLEKQRYRWCSGNFQTLLKHFETILMPCGEFNLHKRLVVVSQLTAWFNLALVPCALLMVWLIIGHVHSVGAALAAGIIVLSLCDIAIRVMARGLRDRLSFPVLLNALACRIALAPQSAKATFDALAGSHMTFIVTDKFGSKSPSVALLHPYHLLLFVTALAVMIASQPTNLLVLGSLLSLMLPLPAAMVTGRSLRAYRETIVAPLMEVIA